jgi:hypothetical protein
MNPTNIIMVKINVVWDTNHSRSVIQIDSALVLNEGNVLSMMCMNIIEIVFLIIISAPIGIVPGITNVGLEYVWLITVLVLIS